MHVIVRNLTDDVGIDWRLDARAHDIVRRTAVTGPEYAGAGLPWRLLPRDPELLLLALPAFGDPEPSDAERAGVARALRVVGATGSASTTGSHRRLDRDHV